MIAVCLLTCGPERLAVTCETVGSFLAFNSGRRDMILLHADGGGAGARENCDVAEDAGFTTIAAPADRVGQIESFRSFMGFVLADPAIEAIAWFENDWASAKPLPPIDFLHRWPGVDQFRLYGDRKMRGYGPRAPAGDKHIRTKRPLEWSQSKESGWEHGYAHWGAGGTIVRPRAIKPWLDLPRLKDVIVATDLDTMRPKENILWHIGEATTRGFFG